LATIKIGECDCIAVYGGLQRICRRAEDYCAAIVEIVDAGRRHPHSPIGHVKSAFRQRRRHRFFIWIPDLFHTRKRRRQALKNLRRLDDRGLRDIGVNRQNIAAIVDREIGRLRLDRFRPRL
jgi:uncharacterized protein YjiS (DUF1127 family)